MAGQTTKTTRFILGTKGRMTQVFDASGTVHPATVVSAGPLTVAQVKTHDKNGYEAVQVGYGERKEQNLAKPQQGHVKDLKPFRWLREFRLPASKEGSDSALYQRGDTIDVSIFEPGDTVTVVATSKGKGFQGVVKRHGFAGGPRTHGQKHTERAPGAIGAQRPQRVLKGKRMAGRMGGDRVTVKNLKVLQVDAETNTLVISGAIPGVPGALVEIQSA